MRGKIARVAGIVGVVLVFFAFGRFINHTASKLSSAYSTVSAKGFFNLPPDEAMDVLYPLALLGVGLTVFGLLLIVMGLLLRRVARRAKGQRPETLADVLEREKASGEDPGR
jgi:hypothetical protein